MESDGELTLLIRNESPGKGFYPMFRFYGPKEGVFDGTWKLADLELMK